MPILKLTLNTGRGIWASTVYIEDTYACVLEGYPMSRLNDRLIANLLKRASAVFGDWPLHLIEPTRTTKEAPFPPPLPPAEHLPSCWIAASFNSSPLSDDMDGSMLILAWFQEQPFPVPTEAVLQQLKAVAWERFARDFAH